MSNEHAPSVVLVVEDEPLLLLNAMLILEEAGYTVIEAYDANDAILILKSGTKVDVVVTDIEMPGSFDGLRLAHAIRKRWPPIKLIVMSGRIDVRADELPSDAIFIAKPYLARHLIQAVT